MNQRWLTLLVGLGSAGRDGGCLGDGQIREKSPGSGIRWQARWPLALARVALRSMRGPGQLGRVGENGRFGVAL